MGSGREGKGAGGGGASKGGKNGKGGKAEKGGKGSGKTWESVLSRNADAVGGNGKGKGKDAKGHGNEKGSGKGKGGKSKGNNRDHSEEEGPALSGAKTVQELESDLLLAKLATKPASPQVGKQPLEAKGAHCEVKKHSEMGCAVVTMESAAAREVILNYIAPKPTTGDEGKKGERREVTLGDHTAQMRPHIDKEKKEEVKTDLFIAWGHKSEKASPLAATTIVEAFDRLYREATMTVASQQQQVWPGVPQMPNSPTTTAMQMPMMAQGQMPMMPPQAMTAMPQACMQQQQQYAYMLALQQQQAMHQQAAAMAMAQQQHMQQQQHLQQQQQQRSEASSGQQQRQAAEGGDSTAPRTPQSTEQGANPEMRADAQPFVYSQSPAGQAGAYSNYNSYDEYGSYGYSGGGATQTERKPLNIVDPKSGQPIEVPMTKDSQNSTPTQPQGPKRMTITNPKTNERVDAVALNFKKADQDRKVFTIINPNDKTVVSAN
mmetsp:Transcript_86823/g.250811  ORF Transcript_86823/g.250811 Transcript_86823/m.250811 type:complete len:489 (+) Transcript_86823:50-1516(+)